jgi:hypothetical protein
MTSKRKLIILLSLLAIPGAAAADPLNREEVLQLTQLGLGDDAVIAKIRADTVDFDLSTDDMLDLKRRGVSSSVIAALISNRYAPKVPQSIDSPDPLVPHPAGLYILHEDRRIMQRMDATVSNQAKTGGLLGYALSAGIASMSVKVAIQSQTSKVPATPNPKFYFFAAESNGDGSAAWANGANSVVNSPAELSLVKLTPKKDRREARVGSVNIAGAKSGVMDKDRIDFSFSAIRPGVYAIEPKEKMAPGEYGFIYSLAGAGTGGAMTAKIFDFTVK